jgi:DMSO reductase anchor subunit
MDSDKNTQKSWLKRLGVAGFLFFLIKGLVWVAIFMGAAEWIKNC